MKKTLSSMMKKGLTILLVLVFSLSAFACDRGKDSTGNSSSVGGNSSSTGGSSSNVEPPKPAVTISIEADKETIKIGEEVNLTVTVLNAEDISYTWSVSENGENLVQIADDVLSIVDGAEIILDTIVTLTATSNEDKNAKASKTIKVIAPVVEGRVGELTSEMIEYIGNPSITVTGTLKDIYFDNRNAYLSDETVYDMSVQMEDGKWKSSWNIASASVDFIPQIIETSYVRSDKDGVKDAYGNVGHELNQLYINKNNEVATKVVKDYMSVPAIWESQHLWNHIANLNVNEFKYNAENDLYVYAVDWNNEASAYLMTYLAYSLTPLLETTLSEIAFVVEDGAISKLIGKVDRTYYGLDEQTGDFDAYEDTIVELTFSNVGSTTVSNPTPYDAPEFAQELQTALDEMKNAKNYTFRTVDTSISAPSGSGDDYEFSAGSEITTKGVNTAPSATGKVGTVGLVTEDKILLHETGKYSYSMDDKVYYYSYSGYVQNEDETYDYFEDEKGVLTGKRKYVGSMFDAMPSFDFSTNVFKFDGSTIEKVGNKNLTLYKFTLRESAITREVAMELSTDGKDGAALANADLAIWVTAINGENHIYKVQIPYDLVSGTYTGTYTITYDSLGTTTIAESYFEDYVPRVIPKVWADTLTKYYQINFQGNWYEENTQTVIDATYGAIGVDIPTPEMIFEIFGDSMNGPFYDWKETDKTDSEGNVIKRGWVSINATASEELLDENSRIIDFDAFKVRMDAIFAKYGYALSPANTDITGGESGQASRWITYTKGDIMVVIENNHTKFFFIDFYKLGDWTLKR